MPNVSCTRKKKVPDPIVICSDTSADEINGRLRRQFVRQFIYIIALFAVDVGIPLVLYFVLIPYLSPVWTLLLSGAPNAISAPLRYILFRSVDTFGLLVFVGFCISAGLAAATSDARILLIRESLLTSILAIIFLISLIPLRIHCWRMKPILFLLTKQILVFPPIRFESDAERLGGSAALTENVYDWQWRTQSRFRKTIRVITFIWSIGLMFEFAGRIVLIILVQELNTVVVWSNALIAFWLVVLVIITFFFARKIRKMAVEDLVRVSKIKEMKDREKEDRNQTATKEVVAEESEPSITNNALPAMEEEPAEENEPSTTDNSVPKSVA